MPDKGIPPLVQNMRCPCTRRQGQVRILCDMMRSRIPPSRSLSGAVGLILLLPLLSGCGTAKGGGSHGTTLKSAWRATVVSELRSPWRTPRTGLVVLYSRTHALLDGAVPLPHVNLTPDHEPQPGAGEAFEALLDQHGLPHRTSGTWTMFVDGQRLFPELIRSINGAKRTVDAQSFIFDNDDFAVRMADLYRAKSHEVRVRVLYDSLGSALAQSVLPETPFPQGFTPPSDMEDYIERGSKVKVRRTTNPFFQADHAKLHIIDGNVAYIGGMNIGREYFSEWHDMMARVEGPVVGQLQDVFNHRWNDESWLKNWTLQNAFSKDKRRAPAPPRDAGSSGGVVPLRVLRTDTGNGRREIAVALQLAIRCARHRVWIETPYLSETTIADDLLAAVKRGVDVRLIIPGKNDSQIMAGSNLASVVPLIRAGARVYKYPRMSHLKVMLCDGWMLMGSANCDTLSLRINRELDIATSAPSVVKQVERDVFRRDFATSARISLKEAEKKGSVLKMIVGDQL